HRGDPAPGLRRRRRPGPGSDRGTPDVRRAAGAVTTPATLRPAPAAGRPRPREPASRSRFPRGRASPGRAPGPGPPPGPGLHPGCGPAGPHDRMPDIEPTPTGPGCPPPHTRMWRHGKLEDSGFPLEQISDYLAEPDCVVWADLCHPDHRSFLTIADELGL